MQLDVVLPTYRAIRTNPLVDKPPELTSFAMAKLAVRMTCQFAVHTQARALTGIAEAAALCRIDAGTLPLVWFPAPLALV